MPRGAGQDDNRAELIDFIIRETGGLCGMAEMEVQNSIEELLHSVLKATNLSALSTRCSTQSAAWLRELEQVFG